MGSVYSLGYSDKHIAIKPTCMNIINTALYVSVELLS